MRGLRAVARAGRAALRPLRGVSHGTSALVANLHASVAAPPALLTGSRNSDAFGHARYASGSAEASSSKCKCGTSLLIFHPYSMLSTTVSRK